MRTQTIRSRHKILAMVVTVWFTPAAVAFVLPESPLTRLSRIPAPVLKSARPATLLVPKDSYQSSRSGLRMQGDSTADDFAAFARKLTRPPVVQWIRAALLSLLLMLLTSLRTVPPANLGIVTTFGHVAEKTLEAGLHLKHPFATVHKFSIKTILLEQQNHVPTKEGLSVDLDVAVLYHIDPSRAREIFLSLGQNYEKVVLQPEMSSAVRGLTSESEAKALYTEGRSEIQKKIKEELTKALAHRGIIVEDVLLKAIKLPAQLTHAIELKAQAEQESARMSFVLDKERQEAERKSIEARGIADFQNIVSKGICKELLQWKAIEATEKFASSSNSKIVIVGNDKGGLPVILSSPDSR